MRQRLSVYRHRPSLVNYLFIYLFIRARRRLTVAGGEGLVPAGHGALDRLDSHHIRVLVSGETAERHPGPERARRYRRRVRGSIDNGHRRGAGYSEHNDIEWSSIIGV